MTSAEASQSSSLFTKGYVLLLAYELCAQFGLFLVTPITSNYCIVLGANIALAGFLAGLYSLAALIGRPFAGLVLSKAPVKPLLIAAAFVFCVASGGVALFPSVEMMGVTRVVQGVAFVIKSSLVISLAVVITDRAYTGRAVGLLGLTNVLANAIGPTIATALQSSFGYGAAFGISTVLFVCMAIMSFFLPAVDIQRGNSAEAKDEVGDTAAGAADMRGATCAADGAGAGAGDGAGGDNYGPVRRVIERFFYLNTMPLALITVLEAILFGSVLYFVLLVSEQRGIENASLFFMAYAIAAFASRPIASKFYDTHGLAVVCLPESILMIAAAAILMFANSLPLVVLSGILLALGQGSLYPQLQAESTRGVPTDKTALSVNTFFIGPDLGMAVGPTIAGAVLQTFGSVALYGMATACAVLFLACYYLYHYMRYVRKRRA